MVRITIIDFHWIFSYPCQTKKFILGTHFFSSTSTSNPQWAAGYFCCEVWDSAGGESHDFCVQNIKEMWNSTESLEQTLCCAAGRGEKRWGKGGNYHIKGKEFKINLISQSPSTPSPKRFTVSMLRLVMRHKESTERVKWRREGRARFWSR